MLKQLKHKFIWINMSLVCIVLLAVLSILCIDSYRKYELESQKAMEQALDHSMFNPSETDSENMTSEEKEKKELPPHPWEREDFMNMIPVYVITLDSQKNIQSIDSTRTDFSEEFINTAAEAAQKAQAQSGYLPDFGMRFMISDTQDGTKIVLADLVHEISALRSLILNCILIFIITTIIFFFISFFLARWALKPVKTAWQQQNQFIADASHELKTPLTVILANLKIITTHMDSTVKDQEIWLKNTLFEAEHMKKLVENLLFLARSQAGMLTFPDTTVNFSDLVLNTLLPFEAVAFEQGIILEEHIENDITIPGNPDLLRQLTAILLDNACKYSGAEKVVTLTLTHSDNKARLSVHNTGQPISEADLPHLFERFYRTDHSRTKETGGYGLGLSIAAAIVQNHQGKIHVTSSAEKGTIFTVDLPLVVQRNQKK